MSFFDVLNSFLPMVIILGLLFGILFLVKKYSFTLGGKKPSLLNVGVIHNQLILPKKYLSLVRVQDKVFVLGISESSITLLKELELSSLGDDSVDNSVSKQSFIELFRQNLGMK